MNLPTSSAVLVAMCARCGDEIELTPYAASLGNRDIMCRNCLRMPPKPKMTPELYHEYLQTEHWQTFRKSILAKRGHRCQVCGRSGKVSLHPNCYDRIGGEIDGDVIVLCETDGDHVGCHQIFHDNGRIAY